MELKLQNKYLHIVATFLQNTVTAKGKKNLHRMRIVKELTNKYTEVAKEEVTLLKEYAKKNDEGEPIVSEKGGYEMEDAKSFKENQTFLYDEYFVIKDENLQSALSTVQKLVESFDKDLSGEEAEAHYILFEAFENQEEKGDEE